jgi:hypothetical protein
MDKAMEPVAFCFVCNKLDKVRLPFTFLCWFYYKRIVIGTFQQKNVSNNERRQTAKTQWNAILINL